MGNEMGNVSRGPFLTDIGEGALVGEYLSSVKLTLLLKIPCLNSL